VRNYVSAILGKLDVADRTQAAVLAIRHGLVE
jgi:DNA-binding NarL/FixJ family response regulator